MAASQEAMQHKLDRVTVEITDSIEVHAAAGDWERVEELAIKLRTAVMQVPEHDRKQAILAAARCLESVQAAAQEAKDAVTGKLSAIRRGKDAARAYAAAD